MGSKKSGWDKKILRDQCGMKGYSVKDLDLRKCLITTAGVYLSEGTDSILRKKTDTIRWYGHCLWAFSYGKFDPENTREFCKDLKDVYLLLRYTNSEHHSSVPSDTREFTYFEDDDKYSDGSVRGFFVKPFDEKNKLYWIPDGLRVTAAARTRKVYQRAGAFCMKELGYIEESFDRDGFASFISQRKRLDKFGSWKDGLESFQGQCDSGCVKVSEEEAGKPLAGFSDGKDTANCLIARLEYPYVITVYREA